MRRELTYEAEAAVWLQANPKAAQQEWLSCGMFSCPLCGANSVLILSTCPVTSWKSRFRITIFNLKEAVEERAQVL